MADVKKVATKTMSLPKSIFDLTVKNYELLKLAYNSYLANARNAHPDTKDRGDVRGGGRKPWRQKGTGRARFGSSRNPIWRGGGVAFGPQGNENHKLRLSVSSKRLAIKQALSLAHKAKKIELIDGFDCPEGKTKQALKLMTNHKVIDSNRVLLVVSDKTDLLLRATNNISNLKVVKANYLNVFDIINADNILITKQAMPIITDWLTKGDK